MAIKLLRDILSVVRERTCALWEQERGFNLARYTGRKDVIYMETNKQDLMFVKTLRKFMRERQFVPLTWDERASVLLRIIPAGYLKQKMNVMGASVASPCPTRSLVESFDQMAQTFIQKGVDAGRQLWLAEQLFGAERLRKELATALEDQSPAIAREVYEQALKTAIGLEGGRRPNFAANFSLL